MNIKSAQSPNFGSNVHLLYNQSSEFKNIYKSIRIKNQLDILKNNGNDDIVTIIPEDNSGWNEPPMLWMYVTKQEGDVMKRYSTTVKDSIVDAYENALKSKFPDKLPNNSLTKEYLV